MSMRNGLSDTQELHIPEQDYDTQRPAPDPNQFRRASWQSNLPEGGQIPQPRRQTAYYEEIPQDERPVRARRPRRRRRRRSCFGCLLILLLTLCILLFGAYSAVSLFAIRQMQHTDTGTRNLTTDYAEPDDQVRNILLIGTDARGTENGRADTVIVLSLSKHNNSLTITSLLRDSYVSIPGHGTNKLNAAYSYGGPTLLMDTIVNNFGIPIDDYICVNFKALVYLIDGLGGVKVTVTDREALAINMILQAEVNEIMGDAEDADMLPSGGTFQLNGKQALSYSRIRQVGNADFERTERQRSVLTLMLDKMKMITPAGVHTILFDALPEMKTNMTDREMYLLSLTLPVNLFRYQQQELRLPADGLFTNQTAPDGQMVLAVDFDANLQLYLKAVNDPLDAE